MKKELIELREAMSKHGIDCYIVPSGDYHGSEYLNDYFKTRAFASGFTGSAGTLVVTQEEARLWTDGRYFLQAAAQLDGSGIELMKMLEEGVPTIDEYLDGLFEAAHVEGAPAYVLGFDGMVLDNSRGEKYREIAEKHGATINCDYNLVGEIWTDRPKLKGAEIWNFPLSSAGIDYQTKIAQVRELMDATGATHHFIAGLAENAWLYNLRGKDVSYSPVFFSFTLIDPDGVTLFLLPGAAENCEIPDGVTVRDYFSAKDALGEIPAGSRLLMDPKSTSYAFFSAVPESVEIIEDLSPVTRLKAIKNPVEIESSINAHIKDGVAMVNFIYWLKKEVPDAAERMALGKAALPTEIYVSDYLEEQRRAQEGFIDLSFDTIAGYMEHGAIIHYKAEPETDKAIRPEGFLLVDSGGHYVDGTTDITRTIAVGPLTEKMIENYTAVLKGHIALATCKFADGVNGDTLDEITRAPLKEFGINYNHGTGHGVGHVLCVHEGPNSISSVGGKDQPILPGMITSDEPGVYYEGEFGIRIESEILCKVADDGDYDFRVITYCPLEPAAIDVNMLTDQELEFVNSYHAEVLDVLSPHLAPEVAEWLAEECKALIR